MNFTDYLQAVLDCSVFVHNGEFMVAYEVYEPDNLHPDSYETLAESCYNGTPAQDAALYFVPMGEFWGV